MKRVLIDWLAEHKMLVGDTVLISEMVVDSWSGRVDVAVVNGFLHAYEVKSAADSLVRLPNQLVRMRRMFDQVTVVCAPTHLNSARALLPKDIGIMTVDSEAPQQLAQRRRAKVMPVSDQDALISFIRRADLEAMLMQAGIEYDQTSFVDEIRSLARRVAIRDVRRFALQSLKVRYADRWLWLQQNLLGRA